jgi:hypothetical protein
MLAAVPPPLPAGALPPAADERLRLRLRLPALFHAER